jgi:hypothetical protein
MRILPYLSLTYVHLEFIEVQFRPHAYSLNQKADPVFYTTTGTTTTIITTT